MLEKVLSCFRGEPEIAETEIKKSNNDLYEEIARKEQELKESDLKEKFKEYISFSKGCKMIHVYFEEKLPEKQRYKILEDINEKIIVTNKNVNVFIDIEYLIENALWIHGIKKENEILLFVDKV